ncbi:hypothetical protein DV723_17230 [Klebsiella pneumoniae]|nr:hypothetical protein [Klebsiella pneumoniae]
MNIKEIGDVFHCDCGFSWSRGKNGNHNCANGLREKVRQLAAENVGLKKFIQTDCFVGHIEPETFYEEEVTRYVSADGYEPETPATDRIYAGIKADGVEEMASTYRGFANKDGCSVNMKCSYNLTAERAESYAAYIRHQMR